VGRATRSINYSELETKEKEVKSSRAERLQQRKATKKRSKYDSSSDEDMSSE
jgi:hypothetical protein